MRRATQEELLDVIIALVCAAIVGVGVLYLASCAEPSPPPEPPPADCHAEETATVVTDRQLEECVDSLRLAKRVVERYEAGAVVCRGDDDE